MTNTDTIAAATTTTTTTTLLQCIVGGWQEGERNTTQNTEFSKRTSLDYLEDSALLRLVWEAPAVHDLASSSSAWMATTNVTTTTGTTTATTTMALATTTTAATTKTATTAAPQETKGRSSKKRTLHFTLRGQVSMGLLRLARRIGVTHLSLEFQSNLDSSFQRLLSFRQGQQDDGNDDDEGTWSLESFNLHCILPASNDDDDNDIVFWQRLQQIVAKYAIQDLSLQLCGHEHHPPHTQQQLGNDNFMVCRQRATDVFRVLLPSLRSFHLWGVVLGGWMIDAIASSLYNHNNNNNCCRLERLVLPHLPKPKSLQHRVLMDALLHNTSLLSLSQGNNNSSNHQEGEEEYCRGILQRNRQLRGLQNLLGTNDLTDALWPVVLQEVSNPTVNYLACRNRALLLQR